MTKPHFQFSLRASTLVFFALAWSYVWRPVALPLFLPGTVQLVVLSALILLSAAAFRKWRWDFQFERTDIVVFVGYLAALLVLNRAMLTESIGGDELVHAGRSVCYLDALEAWTRENSVFALLRDVPVNWLNEGISLVLMIAFAVGFYVYGKLRRQDSSFLRYVAGFALCVVVGAISAQVSAPLEPHAPLRLFPFFLSQIFFGLTDFSFRFPGIVAVAAIATLIQRRIRSRTSGGVTWSVVTGFLVCLIPIVFHVAAIAEPSVWTFVAACGVFLSLDKAEDSRDEKWLILAGLIVGIGALMRQNALLLWPVLAIYVFAFRSFCRRWWLVFVPALFLMPYIFVVAKIGHPVSTVRLAPLEGPTAPRLVGSSSSDVVPAPKRRFPPLNNVIESVTTGIGPMSLLKTNTVAWMMFLLFGMLWALVSVKSKLRYFYLSILFGYLMFFSIGKNLWGMGRYQAEFVAPCIAVTIFLLAINVRRGHAALLVLFLYLGGHSLFVNNTMTQDIHFDHWARRRISTEAMGPYKAAFGYLQRESSAGNFVVLGSMAASEPILLWMRGFSFADVQRFRAAMSVSEELLRAKPTPAEWLEGLNRNGIGYIAIESNIKRARDGRSKDESLFYEQLGELMAGSASPPYSHQATFAGSFEGVIDIYGRPSGHF